MRQVAVVAFAALAACSHERASGMTVSIQKETDSGCYATIGRQAPDPLLALESPGGPCAASDPRILAGLDRLRLVIDYGENVDISPGTAVDPPIVAITLDGVAAAGVVRFEPLARAGDRAYFLATYDVPAVLASGLQVTVQAAADLRVTTETLDVVLPAPTVRVQECANAMCQLDGAATTMHVEVTVPSRSGQLVHLESLLAGVARGDAQTVTTAAIGERMTAITAPVIVPFVDVPRIWTIEARWLGQTATASVSVVRPTLGLMIEECGAAEPCRATAGVGSVRAAITIPGDGPQHATLRSIVAGRIDSELPVVTVALPDHVTHLSQPVAVPFAPEGTPWRLDLVWKTLAQPSRTLALVAPAVTSSIGCAAPCTVAAGATVQLAISAPREIRAATSAFRATSANAQTVEGTLSASSPDEATGTRVWLTTLTAPSAQSVVPWRIDAWVAGYAATTLEVTVVP